MSNPKIERRVMLKKRILIIFEKNREDGIGKNSIKRALELHDAKVRLSINTVKRIVDEFIEIGLIECVNPSKKCRLMFRLMKHRSIHTYSFCSECSNGFFDLCDVGVCGECGSY